MGFESDVGAPLCRALLHKDAIVCQKGEDDVEHLLLMTLIERVVAIRHSSKESLKQTQCSVNVTTVYESRHSSYYDLAFIYLRCNIIRQQTLIQSDAYFLIWYVEFV